MQLKHRHKRCTRFESLESRLLLSASDPSPQEQQLLWLLNRMRTAPQAELQLLLTQGDSNVQQALDFFHVDQSLLASQWSSLTPAQPVAWNADLATAAAGHNDAMSAADQQSHQLPGEPDPGQRILNAGYNYAQAAENVYAYATSMIYAHAGFAIDWGDGPGGIQDPPDHRINMMNDTYRDVGVAVLQQTDPTKQTGPFLVTQDFGQPLNPGNPDLVGTVYNDANQDGAYEPGEGLGGISVTAVGTASEGTFTTTSLSAGGYQLALPDGAYTVTFSESDPTAVPFPAESYSATINGQNALLDALPDDPKATPVPPAPPPVQPPSGTPPPVPATPPKGLLAQANGRTIRGWAMDPDHPATAETIRIDIDGAPVETLSTSIKRPDLKRLGTGPFGFSITTPVLPAGRHTVELFALDDNGTPVSIGSRSFTLAHPVNQKPIGEVDPISQTLTGWACDANSPDAPVNIKVTIDGKPLPIVSASLNRPQLAAQFSSTDHGFSITLPALPSGDHRIRVFALDLQTGIPTLIGAGLLHESRGKKRPRPLRSQMSK